VVDGAVAAAVVGAVVDAAPVDAAPVDAVLGASVEPVEPEDVAVEAVVEVLSAVWPPPVSLCTATPTTPMAATTSASTSNAVLMPSG
jgi:hypothetical protein